MTGDIEVVNETVSMRMLLGWVMGMDKIKIQQVKLGSLHRGHESN